MDEARITRPSPPSTRAIVANEDFCKQVAALLLCERGRSTTPSSASPRKRSWRWCAGHSPTRTTRALTRRRYSPPGLRSVGRGAWSGRPRRPERNSDGELTWALANFWAEHPRELAELLERVQARVNANGRS